MADAGDAHQQTPLTERTPEQVEEFRDAAQARYDELAGRGLKLDLTRGKPSTEQLDLSNELLALPRSHTDRSGTDVRNYGGLQGLVELREIFADLLGVETERLIAGGNSSLTLMRECLVDMILFGGPDSERPWSREERITFLCPVPGYDRHFALLAELGIDMVTVPLRQDGPDVAEVKRLVADDPSVKGMWLVPTYANPTGAVCSQEVAAELAAMPTAAPDFRLMWDNAYALHHLGEDEAKSADILSLAAASGHPNRPLLFASTSKITFAGAGVAFLAGSAENVAWYLAHLGKGSIGPDKVNHLRHAEFFGDADGVRAHMRKHREVLAPKFAEVGRVLGEQLSGLGIAEWTHPEGGYFVSLDVLPGTAGRVVDLAKGLGVALTGAGASYPHGRDPEDHNLRLAPTYPAVAEVTAAMEAVAACVRLAAAERLAGDGAGRAAG